MAAQNEPNFALFTSSDLDFLTDELLTEIDFFTRNRQKLRNKQHFNGFASVVSRAYYAIDTIQDGFRKLKAKIRENGGMVE